MLPDIDELFEFQEDLIITEVPSKTYKIEDNESQSEINEILTNSTFRIINGDLIQIIKNSDINILFELENGNLIISTID